jgi:hypothetical protein
MKELSSKTVDGKKVWFVDGQPSTQFQYQQTLAQNKGYKNLYVMGVQRGYKYRLYKAPEQTFRVKQEFTERPEDIQLIPDMPGYYATTDGVIWCYSERRGRWIIIAQQTQKTGYKVFQPYIGNKRYVKYVHRCVISAYKGPCAEGYEVHHLDGNNANNCLSNLEYMPKDEHRRMKKINKKNK